jgi:hypothetical protein
MPLARFGEISRICGRVGLRAGAIRRANRLLVAQADEPRRKSVMTISDRCWKAVATVAQMERPSVASLLRRNGYEYEARQIEELVSAYKEQAEALREELRHGR